MIMVHPLNVPLTLLMGTLWKEGVAYIITLDVLLCCLAGWVSQMGIGSVKYT